MSADKRTPHTDALDTLGFIIGEGEKRDAIHLAVEPMVAGQMFQAGDHVRIEGGRAYRAAIGEGVGIVDPFLPTHVEPGDRFWLVVYPRRITSLRHVWEHPDFPGKAETDAPAKTDKAQSEQWLRDFCAKADCPGYEAVMAQVLSPIEQWDDEYLHFNGRDAHGEIPDEFWTHAEVVTGQKFDHWRPKHFSCSC